MILSDRDIRRLLAERGGLEISPIKDLEQQLQPASFDVRLSSKYIRSKVPPSLIYHGHRPTPPRGCDPVIDTGRSDNTMSLCEDHFVIDVGPGEFILGSTIESVTIPPDLVAQLDGRSSLGRLGLVIHATAGFIDPGFKGQITLEIFNMRKYTIRLYAGMRIGQLVFYPTSSPAERPYGSNGRFSKYQNQTKPEPSRIEQDYVDGSSS